MLKPIDGKELPYRAIIAGTGSFVPEKTLTNDDLSKMVDTSDEWITSRTGIKSRHICSDDESTALLATNAARQAMKKAGIDAQELDLIIVGTISPEMVFPSTACFVQNELGATNAWAYDVSAACSGFVYSLATAQQFIETGMIKKALIIGADTLSKITDWNDRASAILFGDGAGAVVLEQYEGKDRGILYNTMGSDGSGWKSLNCQAYGSRHPAKRELKDLSMRHISIQGRDIYQQAVRRIVESVHKCLDACNLAADDVKMLISHQMNARIIESAAKRLHLPDEKIFVNIQNYGNTSAASIPIALNECIESGKVSQGDIVIFVAFGAGLTWGANVVCL
ncbi:MAG: ketoacyl-ACP synthase III [Phycisphaeraceae bacterium]|nr:ketoacyl-ACP synthase III [Phycisphaeraceae bacterium]